MKVFRKNFIIAAVILSIIASIAAIPGKTYAKAKYAKGNYWLYGISASAGGNMEMYFNGSTITIDGKVRKASSEKNVYDAKEKKRKYNLKISDSCKVILVEADNVQTIPFRQWIKNNKYKSGDKITFISATLKVFNKKIASITFSA